MNKFYKSDWKISKYDFDKCLDYCTNKIQELGFVINKDLYMDEENSVSAQFIKNDIILDFWLWIDEEIPMILIDYTNIDSPVYSAKSYKEELELYLNLYRNYEKNYIEIIK